jgi:hypothetical protein
MSVCGERYPRADEAKVSDEADTSVLDDELAVCILSEYENGYY